jgi:hypothetical protein
MIVCILFLMECACFSQNLISDVLLCFLIPFSEIASFVSQIAPNAYFVIMDPSMPSLKNGEKHVVFEIYGNH